MITPSSEAELAQAIRDNGPLKIIGGGTRGFAQSAQSNAVLSTASLTGISLYEPGALTLVAAAGTPVAEIEATLEAEGQMLAFEPMDHRKLLGSDGVPTIGGVAAANVSGPRRIQAGAARDAMLGVRFVDGRGDVLKNGGRVMKNVTGYDLVKLLAGSFGTLGVLSEIAVKVLPKPELAGVCLLNGLTDRDAVAAMSAALCSPFDVSGAAHVKTGVDGGPVTMIRVEGFEASVRYRTDQLQALLARFGDVAIETDPARTQAGWAYVRDVAGFAGVDGDVWRVSVKPSDGPAVVAQTNPRDAVFDWGGGLVWLLVDAGVDVRAALGPIAGHATLVRGANRADAFEPLDNALAMISQKLRQEFDPDRKLNPGVMA